MEKKLHIQPIQKWNMHKARPLIISGPCSAESEEQVMETASQLVKHNRVDIFRAGIWKPRTRPNSFEGVGVPGLKWLKKVKDTFNISVGTEVANQKHVYEALKHGIDVLWIGARTSANPFAMQEIADALQGVDVHVLVKNPVNPDLELWIGAIERISKAGITHLGAIHRGFTSFEKKTYRNNPLWQIPFGLRRRIPDIPLINDPSHISGDKIYLKELSQKAMDLAFDGLMIESHYDPSKALSDAKQQITPLELDSLLNSIVLRNIQANKPKLSIELGELREKIDFLDEQMIDILEQRMIVAKSIGMIKKENNLTILQSLRWDHLLNEAIKRSHPKGLSPDFIEKLFQAVHQESINHQMEIMNQ